MEGPYPPLRLYRFPFSTNVERVALALAHKGLEVESVWVDPADRSEVVRISGQELVPVLVDGDRVVADSTAILEHLEERFPERPLYPADPGAAHRAAALRRLVQPGLEAAAEPDRRRGGAGGAGPRAHRRARRRRSPARCRSSRSCSPAATSSSATSSPPPTSSRSRSSSTRCSGRRATRTASTRCCATRSASTAASRGSRAGSGGSTRCPAPRRFGEPPSGPTRR